MLDKKDDSTLSDVCDGSLGRRRKRQKLHTRSSEDKIKGEGTSIAANSTSENDIVRKEMGLGWMLKSKMPAVLETNEIVSEEVQVEESKKTNPRELNPYLKDGGSGYPEESDGVDVAACKLLSPSLVGDGGVSWRLKALKRGQEQATREGRRFQEVVGERWGSLGELTASVASKAAAPAWAHLCDIKSRQRRVTEENSLEYEKPIQRDSKRDYIKNASFHQQNKMVANQFMTQKERCLFCLENPNRPKHLVVSIANFTYLMLPWLQPLVPGHCCILPIHHQSATRTVDEETWVEIRNLKKCLIMMFANQDKEVVFLETVIGLTQQRRHCMIECVPLPKDIAKEAPLYFKKAIDEAEDEWNQHNAKKLIDTSQKGLRNSIPEHFPYFHVEFGINRGFVHVIDNEKNFNSSFGLNILRGMLEVSEEDMYRPPKYETMEIQKQALATFSKQWQKFDWTHELH
ncbi:unnamed protein product [Lathyrus oleraceus]|uniref:CWF19-like protein 2 n=1 Tax=Pisum sativum TaxID=3888 RepID=A0A9D5A6H0_PEA|nr:uncharacterized protein LOC127094555 [Pisum sativum]XP_050889334.1 uncharacterized protein LOC127094555 [Pisum sativum]KAI5396278.1 hypothetical protein KIW84_062471 [Pisum sativum]